MTKTPQFRKNRIDENISKAKKHRGIRHKIDPPTPLLPKVGGKEWAVLNCLFHHFSVKNSVTKTGLSRNTIRSYLKVMKNQGLVIYTSLSWKLTQSGYKYVTSQKIDTPLALPPKRVNFVENGLTFLIDRSHNFRFNVFIVSKPTTNDWLKNWRPYQFGRNTFYNLSEGNITTTYTGKNLIIRLPVNMGDNPITLLEIAKKTVFRLIKRFEATYGLNLNSNTIILSTQHHAFQNEPFSKACADLGITHFYKGVGVDASVNDIPEFEFTDKKRSHEHAHKYILHQHDIVTNCEQLQSDIELDLKKIKLQLKWDL